ncbi:MAG: DUF3105 domain-containing protein [Actinomycetota bacterium]|nr:DUF3105 domain-containing protein [Actinomycetota bacterium]
MAKKKKKNRPPDFDPNLRKRERIEARRQAKAEALERRRKAARRERIVRRIGIAAVLLFVFWFLFIRGGAPDAIAGHEIEHYSTSNGGANPHVTTDVTYDSIPPVSGQHRVQSAPCGTHASPVEDELFVHTLEHGAVAIVYDPTLPLEEVRRIEEIVGSFDTHTLSAPYAGEMETPIAVVAWAHIMRLDEVDGAAIREFIDVFRDGGDAPEAGEQPCPNDADEEFQPASPAPDASPGASPPPASPAPSASPDGSGDKKRETPAP